MEAHKVAKADYLSLKNINNSTECDENKMLNSTSKIDATISCEPELNFLNTMPLKRQTVSNTMKLAAHSNFYSKTC